MYIYFGELYPTELRGMGIGLISAISRIGGLIAPELIYLEKENKHNPVLKSVPLVTFSVIALIGGIVGLLLPETKDKQLLQTVEEAVELYANNDRRIRRRGK